MAVITLTKDNFDREVLQSSTPVLVDFWAPWCGPCKMMGPVVDQIAEQVTTVAVGKVNIDEEPDLATRYGVMTIPTLALFKNGEIADTSVGLRPKEAIIDMITK